jgi:Transmembrane family 220, helix
MKLFNIFFIVLFILSAALQYNDPDPYIWIPIYLYAAWLCYLAYKKKYRRSLFLVGLLIFIPYAAYLFFGVDGVLSWINEHQAESIIGSMKATKPWIEETREFFGLALIIVSIGVNMIWLGKMKPVAARSTQ